MRVKLGTNPPLYAWDPDDATWQYRARAAVADAIGVVNEPWPEPKMVFDQASQTHGFHCVVVEFPSHEGWRGKGWLLVPPNLKGTVPAVVCLPGHGQGADAIIGHEDEPYQADFAVQCVRQGWLTLAVEQVSFGINRSECADAHQSSCVRDSMMALLLGETVTGWRVRDAMAARRALGTLPHVDPTKIATMGISGGGLTALWAAALDPEFCAAAVSGYFCTMEDSIMAVDHCPDNYVPGFARLMDIPELAALVAPRWLAVESGTRDPWFGAGGFAEACSFAEQVYARHGVPERFSSELFEGDHVFKGDTLLAQLHRAFGD